MGGATLRSAAEPEWALLRFSTHPSFYYKLLVLLNHYFSENDSVGLKFSMFSIQLKASFSSCAF